MKYLKLHTHKFSLRNMVVFIDIRVHDERKSIFKSIMDREKIPFKTKGIFLKGNSPYAITVALFRKKYFNDVIRIIDETYNYALLLGYHEIDNYLKKLDEMKANFSKRGLKTE